MTVPGWARPTRLWRSGLVRNALGLYALQASSWLVPLVTLLFLARRLGPDHWGSLVFMQAFATYVIFLVSYGFNFSATREVARHRDDSDRLGHLLAGVTGAKLLLALLALLIVIPASVVVPAIARNHSLLWPAMLWALTWSFSASWYYQGQERMITAAACEAAARLLALAGILVLVRSGDDTWRVLTIQGGLFLGAVALEMGIAYREVGFRMPDLQGAREALRVGRDTFLLTGALSFYTIGNGFILGLFAPPASVGYFVGAERISKNFATVLSPITLAVFPRTSHLASFARHEAARLARTSLLLMGTVACVMGATVFLTAPLLVRLLLGPGFDNAVPVLRILALLPPLVVVTNVLAVQWMLALGLDRSVNAVMAAASLLNVGLAVALVPHHREIGMAVAVVASEALVTGGLYAVLRVKHLDPLAMARLGPGEAPMTATA
ncbi:MAG TPA: oligosaccharide flippase family protein [Candidatus Dormibacteraeota bacterium]|nr:oligosaccharide flippase family protein [Candidatus Dormibacteraeota bacterium]